MFQGFISKFTKNNLVKTAAAACIAASVAFGAPAQIGSSNTYWELAGGVLTISGTGAMPTNFTAAGANNPWYSQRASITSVVIGDGVTTIGDYAFRNHTELTSVTIPNSVTSIGSYAFYNCAGLTSATIPNSVEKIGDSSFGSCKNLTGALNIPNSVKEIEFSAFNSCEKLTSLTLSNSVTSIGTNAFRNCKGLEGALVIPNSVTSIGDYAFQNCSLLTSLTLGNSVERIGTAAFQNCKGLEGALVIPNSVTGAGMGKNTFQNCEKLTSVTLPNSATHIEDDMFNGCKGLTGALVIPASVAQIQTNAFTGCTGLTSIISYRENIGAGSGTSLTSNAFTDVPRNIPLYVPGKALSDCGSNALWSTFTDRRPIAVLAINTQPAATTNTTFGSISGDLSVATDVTENVSMGGATLTRGYQWYSNTTASNTGGTAVSGATSATFAIPANVTAGTRYYYCVASATYAANVTSTVATVNVAKAKITKPTAATGLVYNGSPQSAGIATNDNYTIISGTISSTNAGSFSPVVALKDVANYEWEDGTTANITLPWSIAKAKITKPTATNHVYDGSEQSAGIATNDNYTITGTTSSTNAGSFSASVALKNTTNYEWADGTITSITLPWSIAKAKITKPTATNLVYNGSEQSAGIATNDNYTITGDVKGTFPGSFSASVALKNTTNYEWADGTTASITLPWSIAKASGLAAEVSDFDKIWVSKGHPEEQTFDLTSIALTKSDHGTLVYALGEFTDQEGENRILPSAPTLNESVLTYAGRGKESGIATQKINVTTQNYVDFSFTITFEATPKNKVDIGGLTAQDGTYDGTPKRGVSGTATSGEYKGELVYTYEGTGITEATSTQPKNAGEYTLIVSVPDDNIDYVGSARFTFTIAKVKVTIPTAAANIVYDGSDKSAGIATNDNYTITGDKAKNAGQHTATVELKDKVNYEWSNGTFANLSIIWTIAKANPQYTAPTNLTAKVGQTLANVLPALSDGWSWMNPATAVGEIGDRTHKAKFTPTDVANFNVLENIDVNVKVSAAANPIREIQKSDGRTGIRLSKNVVSDKAEFEVILPNDKVLEVKAAIYDNTGNVVFEKIERGAKLSWNLTNAAGRNVANGTYLIIVEAKGINGNYAYSAKVGVKK